MRDDNVTIIIDHRLVEYFFWPKLERCKIIDPMLMEMTVTIMTATNPTCILT